MSVEIPLHAKREHRYSTINWITFTAMSAFHVGAVAALFYFSWTAVLLTAFFYWVSIGLGIGMGYHRLHTHRSVQGAQAARVLLRRLRHADARRRADLLGRHASPPPPALRHRQRPAHAPSRRLLVAHGMDPLRRGPPQRHQADVEVRARPGRRSVLPVAQHLPLGAADGVRSGDPGAWRLADGLLARVLPRDGRPARDLAGELGDPHVGLAAASRPRTTPRTAGGWPS